jgi:hypothetical protein
MNDTFFKELLDGYVTNTNNPNLKELSDTHAVFQYPDSSEHFYYKKELTKKMKLLYPATVLVIEFNLFHEIGLKKTWYMLYLEDDEDSSSVRVDVKMNNDNLLFGITASEEDELAANDFLSEIKKLPEYRLFAITQD